MRLTRIVMVVTLVLAPALATAQQMFRWIDDNGGVNYSHLESVPERHRGSAVPIGAPAPPPSAPPAADARPAAAQTPAAPVPPGTYWEITHPDGRPLKFAEQARCQEAAERLSKSLNQTIPCVTRVE